METTQNGRAYILEIVSEPPRGVKPGQLLYPPLVVGLRVAEEDSPVSRAMRANAQAGIANEESDTLWAFVHLVPGESEQEEETSSLQIRATAQLTGSLSDSPHSAANDSVTSRMRYFRFQDLAISSVGNYVLRIALCQMSGAQGASRASVQAATTTEYVDTRVVHVSPQAPQWPLEPTQTERLADLVSAGILSEGERDESQ